MFSFDESTETSARFHRKVLRKDFFTKITFRKSVHADFYRYLDVNFVVLFLTPAPTTRRSSSGLMLGPPDDRRAVFEFDMVASSMFLDDCSFWCFG